MVTFYEDELAQGVQLKVERLIHCTLTFCITQGAFITGLLITEQMISLLHTDDDNDAPILQHSVILSHAFLEKKKLSVQKHRKSCGSRCRKNKQRLQMWLYYIKVLYHTYKEKGKEPP